MRIIPIVFDWRTPYMATDAVTASLLTTPIGAGTVLDALRERLQAITREPVVVASAYADMAPYRQAMRAA